MAISNPFMWQPTKIAPPDGTILQPGDSYNVPLKTSSGFKLRVLSLFGGAQLGEAVDTAAIGTPLPVDTSSEAAANTMPTLQQIEFNITDGTGNVFPLDLPLSMIAAAGRLQYTPPTTIELDNQNTYNFTFKNRSARAIRNPFIVLDAVTV